MKRLDLTAIIARANELYRDAKVKDAMRFGYSQAEAESEKALLEIRSDQVHSIAQAIVEAVNDSVDEVI